SPLDSANGTQSLSVNAGANLIEFDAPLGATHPLKSLTATGAQFTALADITTAGGAISISTAPAFPSFFAGNVTLSGAVTTGGGAITILAAAVPTIDISGNVSTGGGAFSATA